MAKAANPLLTELVVGECYLFQTCTKDWVGRLHRIDGAHDVVLTEASWLAYTGERLGELIRTGKPNAETEVEYVGVVGCQWVNWLPWPHEPFKESI